MARISITLAAALVAMTLPASAASLKKSYSYFDISGRTVPEIETQLQQRGPKLSSTGRRHPGATRMEFNTQITYGDIKGRCGIAKATVRVSAKVILPRWKQRGADRDVKFIWETLAADIKRHEEQHVAIAQKHGKVLEAALKRLRPERNCDAMARRAGALTEGMLREHDRVQERFDRDEARGFEDRFIRALERRLASAGR